MEVMILEKEFEYYLDHQAELVSKIQVNTW
jgi:hypothetical protein